MNLSKKEINILVKIGKVFKIDMIYITGNLVVNMYNNSMLNFAEIPFIFGYPTLYRMEDLCKLLDMMNKDSIVVLDDWNNIYINNNLTVYNNTNIYTNNKILNNISNLQLNQPKLIIDNLRDSESFEYAINEYSNTLYNLQSRYIISLHKGLLPVNKSDNVSISIYDYDDTNFICKFSIDKKSFIINIVIKYIYLQ